MRKLFLFIVLIFSLSIVLVGCFNNNDEPRTDSPVVEEPKDDGTNSPTQETSEKEKEPSTPENQYKKVTFREAFSDEIITNPEAFIEKQIPGVKIGLTEKQAIQILGEPNSIEKIQQDWGEGSQWSYDNINGYRLLITFNSDKTIFDYKLIKDLIGKGVIPKDGYLEVPADGEPISYTELGFEGILIGTKLDDVLTRIGEPKLTFLSYDEIYGYNLGLVYQGIDLHFSLENADPYIKLIETNDLDIIKTPRGIQVGSSSEELIQKYGDPGFDWKELGEIIYATEDYWFGLKFIIHNDKIESIHIYEAS